MSPAVLGVVAIHGRLHGRGLVVSRKGREGSTADFIAAGRHVPLWIAALMMTATWVIAATNL